LFQSWISLDLSKTGGDKVTEVGKGVGLGVTVGVGSGVEGVEVGGIVAVGVGTISDDTSAGKVSSGMGTVPTG
jgi:hypothetical protein